MPAGGKLSYRNKEACLADAKAKGMSTEACVNLPSKNAQGINKPGTFQAKAVNQAKAGY